jgi:hypothetical protein
MNEQTIRFPATCPQCGMETLDEYPIAEVAAALIGGGKLRLYASCHEYHWSASEREMEQIREYLGAPWSERQGGSAAGFNRGSES